MKMKKIASFVLLVLLSVSVSACGSGATKSDSASKSTTGQGTAQVTPKKNQVELHLATLSDWGNSEGISKIISQYEQATGNKITMDVYPGDQFLNVVRTKISTDDAPDLILSNFGANFLSYSLFEPLDGPWVAVMEPSVKNRASLDGKVYQAYASPLGYYGAVYNKDIFARAGVKLPMMNYQQLLDGLEAIQKLGVTPIMVPGKDSWTHEMIPAVGGVYVMKKDPSLADKLANNQTKMSQETAFMDLAKRTIALNKFINPDNLTVAYGDEAWKLLLDGKAAMTVMGDWLYDDFSRLAPDKVNDFGIMPITLGDDYISGITSLTQRAYGVPKAAKHAAEAKDFINFALKAENFNTAIAPFKGPSPYTGYKADLNSWQSDMKDMMETNHIPLTNSYLNEFWPSFQYGDSSTPWQAMFSGKAIDKAYDDWYKDYEKINRTAKTPGWQ